MNSHPIIEDCGSLRFAPYLIQYKTLDEDFRASGLERASSWVSVTFSFLILFADIHEVKRLTN